MQKLSGKIIKGSAYGRKLGFPTANLDRREFVRRGLKIKYGVYAGVVLLENGKKYRAGIVIGPKDKTGLPKIEAHLVSFNGNLYGRKVELLLYKYVRTFKKYSDIATLKKQIQADISAIKKLKLT